MQRRFEARQTSLPPIVISVFNNEDDLSIKITDRGGCIHPDKQAFVWQYAWTTINEEETDCADGLQSLDSRGIVYSLSISLLTPTPSPQS